MPTSSKLNQEYPIAKQINETVKCQITQIKMTK